MMTRTTTEKITTMCIGHVEPWAVCRRVNNRPCHFIPPWVPMNPGSGGDMLPPTPPPHATPNTRVFVGFCSTIATTLDVLVAADVPLPMPPSHPQTPTTTATSDVKPTLKRLPSPAYGLFIVTTTTNTDVLPLLLLLAPKHEYHRRCIESDYQILIACHTITTTIILVVIFVIIIIKVGPSVPHQSSFSHNLCMQLTLDPVVMYTAHLWSRSYSIRSIFDLVANVCGWPLTLRCLCSSCCSTTAMVTVAATPPPPPRTITSQTLVPIPRPKGQQQQKGESLGNTSEIPGESLCYRGNCRRPGYGAIVSKHKKNCLCIHNSFYEYTTKLFLQLCVQYRLPRHCT